MDAEKRNAIGLVAWVMEYEDWTIRNVDKGQPNHFYEASRRVQVEAIQDGVAATVWRFKTARAVQLWVAGAAMQAALEAIEKAEDRG